MDNILTALAVQDKEDVISNLLVYCINTSARFADSFVSAIAPRRPSPYLKVSAFSRKQVLGTGVPDIVLVASNTDCYDVFVIENKLKAAEGIDQTVSYAEARCVESLRNTLRSHIPPVNYRRPEYIFLTLFPDQIPQCKEFHHVTYQDLLCSLGSVVTDENPLVNQMWKDLADLLSAFYAAGKTAPDDLVVRHLCQDEGLDGSFLYFANVIRSTDYPAGLLPEDIARGTWTGRKCFFATITKKSWQLKHYGRSLPSYIHIEPQFDCLWHRFPVYVHYELHPYETRKEAMQRHMKRELERYSDIREEFKSYMRDNRPKGFSIRGGWNQIGRTEISLDADTTLDQFQRQLEGCISELQQVIDRFPGLK